MADTTKSLKKAAQARLKDAEALLDGHRYVGACYVAGYVVELLLKAVVLSEYERREGLTGDSLSVDDFCREMIKRDRDTLKTHTPTNLYPIYHSYSRLRTCADWYNNGVRNKCGVLTQWSENWRYENGWVPKNVDHDYAEAFVNNVKQFRDLMRSEVG